MKHMAKLFIIISCLSLSLMSCNKSAENTNSDNNAADFNLNGDESQINSANLNEFSKVEANAESNDNILVLPISVNKNDEITDTAKVELLSVEYEENNITKFENLPLYYNTIFQYEKYFDNDGILKPDYVFIELTLGISSEKSWDEVLLTSFKLEYTYDGQYGSCEPRFVDNCIDFTNPHKGSTVMIKAGETNLFKIGYIILKKEFNNIDDIYLNARFADFNINGSDSLKIKSIDKAAQQ